MKTEQANQIATKALEQLRQALEDGRSERLKEYLAAMARFHRYSWHNVMLIASQKPDATHVAGFHAWHKLGRFVKKGEKGILILAPIIRKKIAENSGTEPEELSAVAGFRAACVFDISQTGGQPLPEIGKVSGDPSEFRERLAGFVRDQGIAIQYSEEIAPARGTSEGGRITLLPGLSSGVEFATLAHEVAHELMHRDERRKNTTKRIRETEAEAVAFVVSSAIGLETGSAAQDYIGLYGGDATLLSRSLEFIQRTAAQILSAIAVNESSGLPGGQSDIHWTLAADRDRLVSCYEKP